MQRNFVAAQPDLLWVGDLSYLRCWEGVVYFAFVLGVCPMKCVWFVDSFKTELIADRVWRTRAQLELAVVEYISWFNHDRLHESLGDIPPVEFEQHHAAIVAADPEALPALDDLASPDRGTTPSGRLRSTVSEQAD